MLDSKIQDAIKSTLRRFPQVESAQLFGSRAKGTHSYNSDIDLAVLGKVSALDAAAIESELDDLSTPLRFDVLSYGNINSSNLKDHINRVGIEIYRRTYHTVS